MHAGKAYVPRYGLGINKVFVRLTRKADDDIGSYGEVRRLAAQRGDHLERIPAAIEAPHAFQDAVAAGLERDVQVPAKARRAGQFDQVGRDVIGVDLAQAKPRRRDGVQQPLHEGCEPQIAVAAEGPEVDAGQHDLAVALGHGLLGAVDQHRFLFAAGDAAKRKRSEEHTSELQSRQYLVCRLLLEKKKKKKNIKTNK